MRFHWRDHHLFYELHFTDILPALVCFSVLSLRAVGEKMRNRPKEGGIKYWWVGLDKDLEAAT